LDKITDLDNAVRRREDSMSVEGNQRSWCESAVRVRGRRRFHHSGAGSSIGAMLRYFDVQRTMTNQLMTIRKKQSYFMRRLVRMSNHNLLCSGNMDISTSQF
jgi:hypothetical protein